MEVPHKLFSFSDTIDGPRGFYAKWNEADREKQIPYDLPNDVESKTKKQTK